MNSGKRGQPMHTRANRRYFLTGKEKSGSGRMEREKKCSRFPGGKDI